MVATFRGSHCDGIVFNQAPKVVGCVAWKVSAFIMRHSCGTRCMQHCAHALWPLLALHLMHSKWQMETGKCEVQLFLLGLIRHSGGRACLPVFSHFPFPISHFPALPASYFNAFLLARAQIASALLWDSCSFVRRKLLKCPVQSCNRAIFALHRDLTAETPTAMEKQQVFPALPNSRRISAKFRGQLRGRGQRGRGASTQQIQRI